MNKQQAAREVLRVLAHMYGTIRGAVRLGDLGALTLGVAVQRRLEEIEGTDGTGGELKRLQTLRESAEKAVEQARTLKQSDFAVVGDGDQVAGVSSNE